MVVHVSLHEITRLRQFRFPSNEQFTRRELVGIDILNVLNPVCIIDIYRSPPCCLQSDDANNERVPLSNMKLLIKCL